MRRAVTAIGAVAVLAMLAGCAPAPVPSWTPPAWSRARVWLTTAPEPLEASLISDLEGQRIRNDAVGIQARWMLLPGAAPLNTRLTQLVRDAVAARAAATRTAYAPAVYPQGAGLGDRDCVRGSTLRPADELLTDPDLGPTAGTGSAVVCDVVAAAGAYLGERVRVVTGTAGALATDVQSVLYADTTTGEVVTADQLWTPDAPAMLWGAVMDALRREHDSLSLATPQPASEDDLALVRAALAQTVVDPAGALVITLPAGLRSPELAELGIDATVDPTTVAVPAAEAAGAVTDFGARLLAAASTPYRGPAEAAAGFDVVDCALLPCVALTYDDGPSDWTDDILDQAAAYDAAVTFFVMGEKSAQYATIEQRAVAEGHLVENHTWNHPHLPTLTTVQVAAQITDTARAITAATGQAPTAFRPPYGDYTTQVITTARMPAILWDVDTFDWQQPADAVVVQRAVDQPRPGSIVLQHDIQACTGRSAAAVYAGLRDRGFTLVNIRQLFGGTLPVAGAWKSAR